MPTKNPRINIVLDPLLFEKVQFLARQEGVSLSTKVRDLLRDSVEVNEDLYLAEIATKREKTLVKSKTLSHKEFWN
ncbi:toxin-antitoxin system, antitoxin component [Thermodesulfobacteriota bacterium]